MCSNQHPSDKCPTTLQLDRCTQNQSFLHNCPIMIGKCLLKRWLGVRHCVRDINCVSCVQDGVTLHLDQGLSNLRQQDMTHVILQTPQQTHFASDTSTHVMGHHLNQAGHLQHSDSPPHLALSVCCAATHHDNVPVSQDHRGTSQSCRHHPRMFLHEFSPLPLE